MLFDIEFRAAKMRIVKNYTYCYCLLWQYFSYKFI